MWNALVADSNTQRGTAVRRGLRAHGFAVRVVARFDLAARLIKSKRSWQAVFVAELVAPLHGTDLLAQTESHLLGTPVIVAVCAADSIIAAILRRGGIEVLVRPTASEVVAAVRQLFDGRGLPRRRNRPRKHALR